MPGIRVWPHHRHERSIRFTIPAIPGGAERLPDQVRGTPMRLRTVTIALVAVALVIVVAAVMMGNATG